MKYVLVCILEELQNDYEFVSGDWPLHVTIVPNFDIDLPLNNLISLLGNGLGDQKAIYTTAYVDDYFGPKKDILVTRLELTPEVAELHNKLIDSLRSNGAKWEAYFYDNELFQHFKPHVTVQNNNRRVDIGQRLKLDRLAVVDKQPGGDSDKRKIAAYIHFN